MGIHRDGDIGKGYKRCSSNKFAIPHFHCRIIYNCILGSPFTVMLDVVTPMVHLKLKYHNLQEELITINVDLEGAKRIYQALQKDQEEYMAMEINVASLTSQLGRIGICSLRCS